MPILRSLHTKTLASEARRVVGYPIISLDGAERDSWADEPTAYLQDGLTVTSHGSPRGLGVPIVKDGQAKQVGPINAAEFARFLARFVNDDERSRLEARGLLVVACTTGGRYLDGNYVGGFAKELSEIMQIRVTAATSPITAAAEVNTVDIPDGSESILDEVDPNAKGKWVIYENGELRLTSTFKSPPLIEIAWPPLTYEPVAAKSTDLLRGPLLGDRGLGAL